jgi:hypothetical protein
VVLKAESYCTCNLPWVFQSACTARSQPRPSSTRQMPVDGDEIMSVAQQSTHVAHDIVHDTAHDTVQDQYTWRRPRRSLIWL